MQQHGSNIMPADPPPTLGKRISRSKSTFSEHSLLHIKFKRITKCSNMVANILPADPVSLNLVSIGHNSTFSEHSHVAYQIKENHECSNMVANILPADLPATLGNGVIRTKFNFCKTWSCCISN